MKRTLLLAALALSALTVSAQNKVKGDYGYL